MNVLVAYVTSVYYGAGPFQRRWFNWLPSSSADRVDRYLLRRSEPVLPLQLVHVRPIGEVLDYAIRRMFPKLAARRYGQILTDRRFSRELPRFGANVVHGHQGCSLSTLRAAKRAGAVAVMEATSPFEYYTQLELEEGGSRDESWYSFESRYIAEERRAADYLLVASELAGRSLVENGVPADKVVNVPYGCFPDRFAPKNRGVSQGEFRVLYVGNINARKGLRYLLEAWKLLGLRNGRLVLVGSADSHGRSVIDQFQGLCEWRGSVSEADLRLEYELADAFVCPSLADNGPHVIYESMAAGLPVVTTENAKAVLRHGTDGFVVPIRDAQAIAEKLEWIYTHRREASAMGAAGRRRILLGYTWNHYSDRLICAYRAMLEGESPNSAVASLENKWADDTGAS